MVIESVVDESNGRSSRLDRDMCSTCEMTVSWMQHQLMQNQTQDSILTYVNEVSITVYCALNYSQFSIILFNPKVEGKV